MFRIRMKGVEDLVKYIEGLEERADEVGNAADGKNDVQRVRTNLRLENRARRAPLMEEEHAGMVSKGEVDERQMNEAYWTIEDIAEYLTGD